MLYSELSEEMKQAVKDSLNLADVSDIPPFVNADDREIENLLIIYSKETDAFWMIGVFDMQEGNITAVHHLEDICDFWDKVRNTYCPEKKSLVYRKTGAKAYVYGLDDFKKRHPFTAADLILWDSEQMDHLLMKYDRDIVQVSFALQYLHYPQIEKLYKAGSEKVVMDWVLKDRYTPRLLEKYGKCFEDRKTINQITAMKKKQWSQLLSFSLTIDEWLWLRSIFSRYRISDDNVPVLARLMIRGQEQFAGSFEELLQCISENRHVWTVDSLIADLVSDHGKTGLSPHEACVYLWDYIGLCRQVSIEPAYRSTELRNEHDAILAAHKNLKNKQRDQNTLPIYRKRYEQLCVYLYEDEDLCVLLPEKWSDLIQEGRDNHNCVGRIYASRYESGKSNIFFVREKKNPEKSYITVELNKRCDRIVQAFYSHNRTITKKRDLAFLEAWLQNNRRI